jgi:hypothetical protein
MRLPKSVPLSVRFQAIVVVLAAAVLAVLGLQLRDQYQTMVAGRVT